VRDGRPFSPRSIKEFKVLPKVAQALKKLRSAGFKIIVVTNQPDVGAGKQSRSAVEAIHKKIVLELSPDAIKVCYHTEAEGCDCRKPKPGMLLQAAAEEFIDLKKSFMIGDRWRDIQAGKAAGCGTILIKSDYKEKEARDPDAVAASLFEASQLILSGLPLKRKK